MRKSPFLFQYFRRDNFPSNYFFNIYEKELDKQINKIYIPLNENAHH